MSIKLMTYVWDDTRFFGDQLLILLCLADHANDAGECWPSYDRIALRCRCTKRHAIRCIERLRQEGWITKECQQRNGRQTSNLFCLNLGGVTPCHPKSRGDICDTGGVTSEAFRGDIQVTRIIRNHQESSIGSDEPEEADLNQPF